MSEKSEQSDNMAMSWEERKSWLRRGDAYRLAKRLKPPITPGTVYHELRGVQRRSLRVRKALARLIARRAGVPEEAVFGPGSLSRSAAQHLKLEQPGRRTA